MCGDPLVDRRGELRLLQAGEFRDLPERVRLDQAHALGEIPYGDHAVGEC